MYLPLTKSPGEESTKAALADLLGKLPDSYRPIPIIHSLSFTSRTEWSKTTFSMDEFLQLSDQYNHNTPFLWVGPNAPGHIKTRKATEAGNPVEQFTLEMANEAQERGMEVLNLYNVSVQASSFDGTNYGEKVAIQEAMMVINWLSRLETT
jgi:hypothetical protein